jgi:hypothetical protein
MSKKSNVGKLIEESILLNIKIWHEATKVKDIFGKLRDKNMPTKERVACALKIRELNAERSAKRWEIDKLFGGGTNETKIFSGGK